MHLGQICPLYFVQCPRCGQSAAHMPGGCPLNSPPGPAGGYGGGYGGGYVGGYGVGYGSAVWSGSFGVGDPVASSVGGVGVAPTPVAAHHLLPPVASGFGPGQQIKKRNRGKKKKQKQKQQQQHHPSRPHGDGTSHRAIKRRKVKAEDEEEQQQQQQQQQNAESRRPEPRSQVPLEIAEEPPRVALPGSAAVPSRQTHGQDMNTEAAGAAQTDGMKVEDMTDGD